MNFTTPAKVGWAHEPNGRGTLGLIWSCIITWFLCLWTLFHMNIPALGESRLTIIGRRIGLLIFGVVVALEYVASIAFTQWRDAKRFLDRVSRINQPLLAAKEQPDEEQAKKINRRTAITSKPPKHWTLVHGFCCIMGVFSIALPEDESKQFPVNAEQFCWLIENEIIELPTISVEDIKDKSRMNSYTKFITIFQTLWFLLQTIARGVQGLGVSTLEITTVAYITCMLPWMAFWWRKPFDVGTPTRLKILRWPDGTRKELEKHSSKGSFLYRKRDLVEFPHMPNTISIEDHWMTRGLTTESPNWYGTFVDGLLFGGLRCAAWSFEFPTLIECWLWRASGLVIVFMAFLGLYFYW